MHTRARTRTHACRSKSQQHSLCDVVGEKLTRLSFVLLNFHATGFKFDDCRQKGNHKDADPISHSVSRSDRSVATGNQWSGSIKSFPDRFHWLSPLVSRSNWSDRQTSQKVDWNLYMLYVVGVGSLTLVLQNLTFNTRARTYVAFSTRNMLGEGKRGKRGPKR